MITWSKEQTEVDLLQVGHVYDEPCLHFQTIHLEEFPKKLKVLIGDAEHIAATQHEGQERGESREGEYVNHAYRVAIALNDFSLRAGIDPETRAILMICGLIHDVVEDTEYAIEKIRKTFGEEITKIVDALTKIKDDGTISKNGLVEKRRKKLFTAMRKDWRVIIIKLFDRDDNFVCRFSQQYTRWERKVEQTLDHLIPDVKEALNNCQPPETIKLMILQILEVLRFQALSLKQRCKYEKQFPPPSA
jgi:(p)ppGpp synthase/HD superfamily hydrolase